MQATGQAQLPAEPDHPSSPRSRHILTPGAQAGGSVCEEHVATALPKGALNEPAACQVYLMLHGAPQMSVQHQHFVKTNLNKQLKKEALLGERLGSPLAQPCHLQ